MMSCRKIPRLIKVHLIMIVFDINLAFFIAPLKMKLFT